MAYNLGLKALHSLCAGQSIVAWQKAKLASCMFKPHEQQAFDYVQSHVQKHHKLPQVVTLTAQFPDVSELQTPEPSSYYVERLENQYFYDRINRANLESQEALKKDQDNYPAAMEALSTCLNDITHQRYRLRIVNVGQEAPKMVKQAYDQAHNHDLMAEFGWPYMDDSGGVIGGDLVSYVGRPAMGKTWQMLWTALYNWRKGRDVLFVSMEMNVLAIIQRIAAMYTHFPITQIKSGTFATIPDTYTKCFTTLAGMKLEKSNFYVVDGNLAANVEEIYQLADQLGCLLVFVDGAYLVRHANARLDRYTRAAENCEMMKRYTGDMGTATFSSWQLKRGTQDGQKKKKGKQEADVDLDDIGYTDVIGQISSISLGLLQDDGIETMVRRTIKVLKGRNGEIGQFSTFWNFNQMDFSQCDPPIKGLAIEQQDLQWL